MSIGGPTLATNIKAVTPTPATVTAANNGVSLNGTTVQLGQAQGDPLNPAVFTGPREVQELGYGFTFLGSENNPGVLPYLAFFQGFIDAGVDVAITSPPLIGYRCSNVNPAISNANAANVGIFGMNSGGCAAVFGDDGTFLKFDSVGTGVVWLTTNISDDPPTGPGFYSLNISMGTNRELFGGRQVLESAVTPYTIDRSIGDLDRKMFTNGSVANITYELPQAQIGYEYEFAVLQAGTLTIQPNGSDIIIISSVTGAAGAPATCAAPGAVIRLTCVAGGTWLATTLIDTWVV